MKRSAIRIEDHQLAWAFNFQAEAARIKQTVGQAVVRVHHIGSTAIAQIMAKPVIDILLEVASLEAFDRCSPHLEALGYEALGDYGIPGRRYFRLDDADGIRTHQIHAFEAGVHEVIRHVAFRDYLRAHPSIAAQYGALKEGLAAEHPYDTTAYSNGKRAFVDEHERRALQWAKDRTRNV